MKIHLVTPAKENSRNGNRTSAMRWAGLLRSAGHRVRIDTDYNGEPTDLVIALHAWRSAAAIRRYREASPEGPLVVALGGTDVNTYLKTDPQTTLDSMKMADALVGLHDLVAAELPPEFRRKLSVIRQSAKPLPRPRNPSKRCFDICVIGHLREEKDPFRTALAARLLPVESRVRVLHYGKAHGPEWALQAEAEMRVNPRYRWQGEVSAGQVRQALLRAHLMVISSLQEGGANVVSEALVGGVPIIASDIAGNIGLLGRDYGGYFRVGDETSLAERIRRAEVDERFLKSLQRQGRALAPMFTPEQELSAWQKLLATIT
ncbi:MAG: selenosugar synthase SenB [Gammaproteobacteria bacterium]|nr:selenosugar synthase SenB [Gammaproteobacteria bacterium]